MREAIDDWTIKRALQLKEREALKAEIAKDRADLAKARVKDFDTARIIERGRKVLPTR